MSELDKVYHQRAMAVQLAAIFAKKAGYSSGIRSPCDDPEWKVVVIDTPFIKMIYL